MSVAPQWFERKTSILVPAVFAVLMKMNLYLCDRIIEPRQLSEQQVARPVKNRQHSRNQTMHCKFGRPGADDFFSNVFSSFTFQRQLVIQFRAFSGITRRMSSWHYAENRTGSSVSGCAILTTKLKNIQRWLSIAKPSEMSNFAACTNSPVCETRGTGWCRIISRRRKVRKLGIGRNSGELFPKLYRSQTISGWIRVKKILLPISTASCASRISR